MTLPTDDMSMSGDPGSRRDFERQRFRALIRVILGNSDKQISRLAATVYMSESAIRTWRDSDGKVAPRLPKMEEVFEHLTLPSDILGYDEPNWERFLQDLRQGRRRVRLLMRQPEWFYTPDEILLRESTTDKGATIIIVTADGFNDTQRPDIKKLVANNVARGVNYIYITPGDCKYQDDLKRFVSNIRSRPDPGSKDDKDAKPTGKVNILFTSIDHRSHVEWKWIDHAMLVIGPAFDVTFERLKTIEVEDVDIAYEQLYKIGDVAEGRHFVSGYIWTQSPFRKVDLYLRLIRDLSETSRWF